MKNRHSRRSHRWMSFLSLCLVAGPLFAQASDPVFGTWVLDHERSTFRGGPEPLEQTRIYEPDPQGLKATVITVNRDGTETVTSYVARYDGVEYPFLGVEDADVIIMRRDGPNSAVVEFRHGGRVIGEARRVVAEDGQEMTVTVRIDNRINRIAVFRRKE